MKFEDEKYQFVGWILFLVCSLCYIISSIISKDIFGILGGLLFLGGCLAFIIPIVTAVMKNCE